MASYTRLLYDILEMLVSTQQNTMMTIESFLPVQQLKEPDTLLELLHTVFAPLCCILSLKVNIL